MSHTIPAVPACAEDDPWLVAGNSNFILFGVASVFLVLFGGVMSGLSCGLMQLDECTLVGLEKEGTPKEMWMARWLLPLTRRRHLSLVTLLISNALAMEALPIFLDILVPKVAAILLSVTMVVFFGEIIPQGMCLRYPQEMSAHFAWLVYLLGALLLPIAYPISLLLDHVLGADHMQMLNRAGLWSLALQHSKKDHNGPLQEDEVAIITGALAMYGRQCVDVMMPLDRVYALSLDSVLDDKKMIEILNKGYSRVLVYEGTRTRIVGFIIVKQLARVRLPVNIRNLVLADPLRLPPSHKVYDLLASFRAGSSHVAVIEEDNHEEDEGKEDQKILAIPSTAEVDETSRLMLPTYEEDDKMKFCTGKRTTIGIVTLEDVLESLLQMDIRDETDTWGPANNSLNKSMENLRRLRNRIDIALQNSSQTSIKQTSPSTSSSVSILPMPSNSPNSNRIEQDEKSMYDASNTGYGAL